MTWLFKGEKRMHGRKPELCEGIKEKVFMGAIEFKGKKSSVEVVYYDNL